MLKHSTLWCSAVPARGGEGGLPVPHLLEGSLGQQVPLDARERLVGVVVGLLNQA